jgi:hypothetical protein
LPHPRRHAGHDTAIVESRYQTAPDRQSDLGAWAMRRRRQSELLAEIARLDPTALPLSERDQLRMLPSESPQGPHLKWDIGSNKMGTTDRYCLQRADWLQLRQLGIGDLHDLFLIPILERMRLRSPAQLFKPLSHLTPAHLTSITVFTVWAVNSQARQQVADATSQVHNRPPTFSKNWLSTALSVGLAASDARTFSKNTRMRATCECPAGILFPPADRHSDPAVALHLGHGIVVKSAFISGSIGKAVCAEPRMWITSPLSLDSRPRPTLTDGRSLKVLGQKWKGSGNFPRVPVPPTLSPPTT